MTEQTLKDCGKEIKRQRTFLERLYVDKDSLLLYTGEPKLISVLEDEYLTYKVPIEGRPSPCTFRLRENSDSEKTLFHVYVSQTAPGIRNAEKIFKSPKCFKVQAQGNNPNIFEIKYIYLGFNTESFIQLNIRADDPSSVFVKKLTTQTKQYNT